eukprot:CAMPEP_0170542192 /NCGR_PEP_ID=MMETSP0211-20121228/1695_1 /TAXON_ID=311385 /ORGANISM="Pseudokeronopsis sp., Strain OXSARD2" /LENGTH=146 /DNA_ID=CAMNT_0010845175 /DNA_START=263 /DNA_END=702 /DNA_ORIENTATION=-
MNQLYFHSKGQFFALNDRNSYFLLAICIVLAAKYYEEPCFFNSQKERFYFEKDYFRATSIPPAYSKDLQLYILRKVDHRLYVAEEEYGQFMEKIFGVYGGSGKLAAASEDYVLGPRRAAPDGSGEPREHPRHWAAEYRGGKKTNEF